MPRRAFHRRTLSLTPLIDVMFLLLLFFMLTSTFARFGEIEVSAASEGGSTAYEDVRFVQLGEDTLSLAGREVALASLPGELENARVLVSLRPGASAQRLVDLLVMLRGTPGLSLKVLR